MPCASPTAQETLLSLRPLALSYHTRETVDWRGVNMLAMVRRYDMGYGLGLHARYDEQYGADSGSSQPDSGATTDRIIIGVVVGGVATIAITAGIFFFLFKKRKWDRIKRYEEHLLAMRASSSAEYNKPRGFTPEPYTTSNRPYSSVWSYGPPPRQQQDHDQQHHQQRRPSVESPPPAYHQPYPAYDPSQYPRVSLPASVRPHRESTGRASSSFSGVRGHALSGSGSGLGIGSEDASGSIPLTQFGHPEPMTHPIQSRPSYQRDPRGPSPEGSTSVQSDDTAGRPSVEGTAAPPRRPKPALSRLITNFG
ncbi:hypothetical protein HFD88_000451 [Aspergillus terreus]|nr:hypothetical protein HFD88_000451 [Aspergillus terreus]